LRPNVYPRVSPNATELCPSDAPASHAPPSPAPEFAEPTMGESPVNARGDTAARASDAALEARERHATRIANPRHAPLELGASITGAN
jgi:hypothetical protein